MTEDRSKFAPRNQAQAYRNLAQQALEMVAVYEVKGKLFACDGNKLVPPLDSKRHTKLRPLCFWRQ
jgi:hypothetical protein